MESDISTDPASIKYFLYQKKTGNTFLNLSEESKSLINNWEIKTQSHNFFFEGPENADIFIIDSGTGFFKGDSGVLLKKILKAMNLSYDSIFICNSDDLKSVQEKIKIVFPEIIITLGTKAGQSLLKIEKPLEHFRGKFYDYNGIKVMPTFHPSLLLKNPEYKRQVWEDMKLVMENAGSKHDS